MHHRQALKNRNEIHVYALAFNGTFFVSRTDFDEININIFTFAPSIFQLSITRFLNKAVLVVFLYAVVQTGALNKTQHLNTNMYYKRYKGRCKLGV